MTDEDDEALEDFPTPPLPVGLNMPLPPPPPGISMEAPEISPLPSPPLPPGIEMEEGGAIVSTDLSGDDSSTDFLSSWNRRKQENPRLDSDNRDRMYGHIDRIAIGEVGTLLDRFSDRFGSELDREIIVLRKKQQQDMRDIKPVVELISPPSEEYEEESESESEKDREREEEFDDDSGEFVEFFNVVNELLGGMPDDFISTFVESDDFQLFQNVGSDPNAVDEETQRVFFNMINKVLGELPAEKIDEFVDSPDFELFQRMGQVYGA
jgi:hypothetical protein